MKGLSGKLKMGKMAALLSMAALCLLGMRPARAGSWSVLRYEYNGTNKMHYDNYPQPPSAPLDVTEQWSDIGSTGGGTSGASGYPTGSGGWRHSSGSVRTVFKWMRNRIADGAGGTFDPYDNPPSVLYLRLSMSALAIAQSDTRENAPNRDAGKEKVSASAMGKTGETQDTGSGKSSGAQAVRVVRVETGGQEEVPGPWCSANARAEVMDGRSITSTSSGSYGSYGSSGGYSYVTDIPGSFGASVSYAAQLANFAVSTSAQLFNYSKLEADDKELDVYVDQNFAIVGNAGDPLRAFWEGAAGYSIVASVDNVSIFAQQEYAWSISGQLSPLPQNATEAEIVLRDPNYSAPNKFFPFDLGDVTEASLDSFPKSTTVLGSVTGAAADSEVLTGKVKINWHLRPATIFRFQMQLESLVPSDELPDDGGDLDWATAEAIDAAKREAQRQGGTLVKLALEGEMIVGSWYFPDEVDAGLGLLKAVKAVTVLGKVKAALGSLPGKALQKLRAKRAAQGKPDNAVIRWLVKVTKSGNLGEPPPGFRREPDPDTSASADEGLAGDGTGRRYNNKNPDADDDEIRVGTLLDKMGERGELPGISLVEGRPEMPNVRSGDYDYQRPDGTWGIGDHYGPGVATDASGIISGIQKKSGQCDTVVVELPAGSVADLDELRRRVQSDVLDTPGLSIIRVIVIRGDQIIIDLWR